MRSRNLFTGLVVVLVVGGCASAKPIGGYGAGVVEDDDAGTEVRDAGKKKPTGPSGAPKTDAGEAAPIEEDAGGPPVVTTDAGRTDSGPGGACDNKGVDLSLRAKGKVETKTLTFTKPDLLAPFNSVSACPIASSLSTVADRPFETVVVQNDTGSTASLSAWAVCDAKGDAFLSFYRGSDIPLSESARRECAIGTILSNGYSSTLGGPNGDAHKSPESNGSSFCPSLLATNNVGLRLAPCEKAVVFIHPYADPATSPPPSALKIKVD